MINSILTLKNGKLLNETAARLEDLAKRKQLVWIDATNPSEDEIRILENTFSISIPEKMHSSSYKTLFENYQNCTFFETHEISYSKGAVHFHSMQILLGSFFVVTIHNGSLKTMDKVIGRFRKKPELFKQNPAVLVHHLLDEIVDDFLETMEAIQDTIDTLESKIFSDTSDQTIRRIFKLKRSAIRLRKVTVQQRELLNFLARGDSPFINSTENTSFQELYDHMLLVTHIVETIRELITSLLEVHVSLLSQKLNEVMKTLTIFATILLPMTLITGIYGMNFLFIPEIHTPWGKLYGYYFAIALMVGIAVIMLGYFKRKRWF